MTGVAQTPDNQQKRVTWLHPVQKGPVSDGRWNRVRKCGDHHSGSITVSMAGRHLLTGGHCPGRVQDAQHANQVFCQVIDQNVIPMRYQLAGADNAPRMALARVIYQASRLL